jgi:hypothetical protein
MVSLGEVFIGIAGSHIIAVLWTWRGTRNIWSNYGDGFDEMKTYRASQFRSELHDIVMDVLDDVDLVKHQLNDESEVVVMDAMEKVGRDRLKEVEDALRHYDKPNELIDQAEEEYESAVKSLSIGFVLALVVIIASATVQNPQDKQGLQFLFGILWAVVVISAGQSFFSAWNAEKDINEAIRNYQDDY